MNTWRWIYYLYFIKCFSLGLGVSLCMAHQKESVYGSMEALSSVILLLYWSLLMEWQSVVEGMLHNLSLTLLVYLSLDYGFHKCFYTSWEPKNWCFWSVVLEKTLESPFDRKEIQPVHPKGNQSWIFIGRTDDEAETPILWPLDVKNWLIWKDRDAGKDWRQEVKGTTEDEMAGWHHWLDGHEFV